MTTRPILRALADRLGILPEYLNYNATQVCATSDETREALLCAMGHDVWDEQAAAAALTRLESDEQSRLLDPVAVLPANSASKTAIRLRTGAPVGTEVDWVFVLSLEYGGSQRAQGRQMVAGADGVLAIECPWSIAIGVHQLDATVRVGGRERHGRQCLIIAPERCASVAERTAERQAAGLWINLYSLRSSRHWGIGDFGDLRTLIEWCGETGLAFVALNPLHALRNRGQDVSPYRPTSRLYRNEIYLDVEAIPELSQSADARRLIGSPRFQAELARLRNADMVLYDEVRALKRSVLQALHAAFRTRESADESPRGQAYRTYLEQQGRTLIDFATFTALDEHFHAARPPLFDWRTWPTEFRDPCSATVDRFRNEHADEIDLHCFIQFELDRQLATLAALARDKGLAVGLFEDLAIGTAPDGSDPWAFPGLFVGGASVGAPPDDLGPKGQNWALPPLHPNRLRESGYDYWRRLLQNALAHAGALRIDHVMGLLRQFWIPEGKDGTHGAYVRFPVDELFALLALESRRRGALVIGEDLGTVPAGFAALLERWGVLSTKVVYFERDFTGEFLAAPQYSDRAYTVVSTHDMVPLAGFRDGVDLQLRHEVGAAGHEADLADALARRQRDFDALRRRLLAEGLVRGDDEADNEELGAPLVAFLRRTPAPLIGISLDDLAGESRPVNLPGVGQDRHRNWSRRMRMSLEQLCASEAVRAAIRPDGDGVR